MMKKKDARFILEYNREGIIFWAVIFLPCVVGYLSSKFFLISVLYFGLLIDSSIGRNLIGGLRHE